MSFLKFLSIVSLSLLFLGNVVAECVDLSGTYSCEDGMITLSKTSDKGDIFDYSVTTTEVNLRYTPFDFSHLPKYATTICTKNKMETKIEASPGDIENMTIITVVLEEKILTARSISVVPGDVYSGVIKEITCRKQ